MNTWTDGGIADAGLVGAMLALGLDTAPAREAAPPGIAPAAGARGADVRTLGSARGDGPVGRRRFPAPERSPARLPSSFPPPPMPEPKLASDDLAGWTDGFLAGGSPLSDPASWDEPSSASPSGLGDRSAAQPAELTSMMDGLLDPGRASRMAAPAAPVPVVPARLEARPAHSAGPEGPSGPAVSGGSATAAPGSPAGSSPVGSSAQPFGLGSGPLDGPLDVDELEPAQLDFEVAPLDPTTPAPTQLEPTSLEPTLLEPTTLEPTPLEPTSAGDRPAEEPSLAELTGLDRPGLGPVVLGSLGLESMDLDASAFTPSPEYPPPAEPAAPEPAAGAAVPRSESTGGSHRRADSTAPPRHRRNDDMSPLSSLDDSPLYSSLRRD